LSVQAFKWAVFERSRLERFGASMHCFIESEKDSVFE